MTVVTAEQLAEWKRLADAATEGPWETRENAPGDLHGRVVSPKGDAELGNWLVGDIRWAENRAFIAASRTAVPALVAEVERLRKALRKIADHEAPAGASYDMVAIARSALPEESAGG